MGSKNSLKDKILRLKQKGLSHNSIVKELGCAKSTVSYHCKLAGLGADPTKLVDWIAVNDYYQSHTLKETAKFFGVTTYQVKPKCRKAQERGLLTGEERRKRNVIAVVKRRRKIKGMAVEHKGGCCEICKYNKCIWALHFHHKDPSQKDFNLSREGHSRSWDRVKKEIDKCMLVCANCHAEIHAKQYMST